MIFCLGGGYPPPKQKIRMPKRPNDFSFFRKVNCVIVWLIDYE